MKIEINNHNMITYYNKKYMAQIGLYYHSTLEQKVSLLPHQLDGDMDDYLLQNLRVKVEGRNIDAGNVLKVQNIISYNLGVVGEINFMATVVYRVKYNCLLCSPVRNLEIVCVIENVNVKRLIVARNGPLNIIMHDNASDADKFKVENNQTIYKKTGTALRIGDFVRVVIISTNINRGEKNMLCMAKLLDIANEDQIKRFESEQAQFTHNKTRNESSDKNFI